MTTKSGKGKSSSGAKGAKEARKAPAKTPAKTKPRSQSGAPKPAKKTSKPAAKPVAAKPAAPKAPARQPAPPARAPKVKRRVRTKEFERYRPILLERQRELLEAYNLSRGDRRVHPGSGTEDYIDYAVSSYAKEFLLSLSEMDRKQLLLVKEAVGRLDRSEYGSCQQCGDDISPKRLEVAPWARYCLRCQDLEEQGLLPQYPSRLEGDEEEGEEVAAPDSEEELETEEVEDLEEEPLGGAEEDAEEADE